MAKEKTESQQQPGGPTADSPHPALKLRHTLRGHTVKINNIVWAPSGGWLASAADDGTVRVWAPETGKLIHLLRHAEKKRDEQYVFDVGVMGDGRTLVSGSRQCLRIWDAIEGTAIRTIKGYGPGVVPMPADDQVLTSILRDGKPAVVCRLSLSKGEVWRSKLSDPDVSPVVAVTPDGRFVILAVGEALRLLDASSGSEVKVLRKGRRTDAFSTYLTELTSLAVSPQGDRVVAGSADRSIYVYDLKGYRLEQTLEGHTEAITGVAFSPDGKLLASKGWQENIRLWNVETWKELSVLFEGEGSTYRHVTPRFHPRQSSVLATFGEEQLAVRIWDLNLAQLLGTEPATPTVFYVNAKAVLLGESSVGKSGLGIRIAEGKFRKTESTHGAQFWHFPTERLPALPPNVQAELTLWDFAGQPGYRLTHQLFLDDTDAALLLFDCSDPNDPFRGVPYWAKALKKHAPNARKFLVSARCDVSPVTVHDREINQTLADYGLDKYFKTSAKTGEGVEQVFQRLMSEIPWDKLPRTSTPKLFQVVREFLLERKQAGANLIGMDEVRRAAAARFTERAATQAELDTVVQLLQSRGLVYRLEPRPGAVWVLLKPERINQYGASIVHEARNRKIGAVPEREVLTGNIPFVGFERLPPAEESVVLEGTVELLMRHDLGFREMGNLVFPSQISVTRQQPEAAHPRTEVAYRFSGSIETIYASLVVRLSYTGHFQREDQWKYAAEFSRAGNRLGFSMRQIEEGTGELEIYFQPGISEFDRVTFIRFVTDHLRAKGIDIQEQIRLYCPKCSKEVTNREAIEARIRDGKLDIPCQFCVTAVVIPKSVEEIYRRDPSLGEKQAQLTKTVEQRTEAEVKQFRADQQQYTEAEDDQVHILHLSDLHFGDDTFAGVCRTQLETDLIQELGIRRLEYLIISGDVASRSNEKEYDAAFAMVNGLVKRFGLDASRVVVVPGNHDVNWDRSEEAYPFVPKRKLPSPLPEGKCIPAGEAGALLRDDEAYRDRFAYFNTHFYRRVYSGQDYPPEYADQALFVERPEDRILFLGLNSCWQLDHYFRDRASIHTPALTQVLDRLQDGRYQDWLKIAVWHHPVTGQQPMNDEFMQLLAVHGFHIGMHGHIHEAIEGFHKYDDSRAVKIIGAGTFGAPAKEQVTGIPLQYNLLTFDPRTGAMTVNTRKKEKPNGAWSADARWGNKNDPKPWYRFTVANYKTHG